MDTFTIFDRVCAVKEISQETFLSHLNYALAELCAMYGEDKVMEGAPHPTEKVGDAVNVYEEYVPAILDDILFLVTGDDRHKTDFVSHARYAYNTLWRKRNLRRRIRREVW